MSAVVTSVPLAAAAIDCVRAYPISTTVFASGELMDCATNLCVETPRRSCEKVCSDS